MINMHEISNEELLQYVKDNISVEIKKGYTRGSISKKDHSIESVPDELIIKFNGDISGRGDIRDGS